MPKKQVTNDISEELPSNSMASRTAPIRETARRSSAIVQTEEEPRRRVNRPDSPRASRRKPTFVQSIARSFLGQSAGGIGGHILYEILLPVVKSTIQEMATSAIDMALYGETGGRSRSRDRSNKTVINYSSIYKKRDRDEDRRDIRKPRTGSRFDLDNIVFDSGLEAIDTLKELCDLLEEYNQVSVADYFELGGIDGVTWAHSNWGWDDLSRAYVTNVRDGSVIVLPPPIALES